MQVAPPSSPWPSTTAEPPLQPRQALPAGLCERWLQAVGASDGPSRRLSDLKELDPAEVLHALAHSPLRASIEQRLGPAPACDLDQSWLRHGRPPHGWHQDGALRFDFMAEAPSAAALLPMLTCWIALTPCGDDAPGLEWVTGLVTDMLAPAQLTDHAVQTRVGARDMQRPHMQPGDTLLFDGHLLHRTALDARMSASRTSLELRFFRADDLPARVAGDRFARW